MRAVSMSCRRSAQRAVRAVRAHRAGNAAPAGRALSAIARCSSARRSAGAMPMSATRRRKAAAASPPRASCKGDRVAILCGNRPEFLDLFLGLRLDRRRLGADQCCGARTAARAHAEDIGRAAAGAGDANGCRRWNSSISRGLRSKQSGLSIPITPCPAQHQGVPVRVLPDRAAPVPPADLKPHDLLTILFTSGTTGPSKGVCCPHAQFFWWGFNVLRQLALRDGDVLHTTLPLFHVNAHGARFFQALLNGCTQVVEKRFSASNFWPALVASGATVTYVLGAMVPMLLSRPPCPRTNAAQGAGRAGAGRAGASARGVHRAHRHPSARRLRRDRKQCRDRHHHRHAAAGLDGQAVRGLPRARCR